MQFQFTKRNYNLPEGSYTFTVQDVEDDEFGKVKVRLATDDGRTQTMFFDTNKDYPRAQLSELYFGATGGGEEGQNFDTQDMVGGCFTADIVHTKAKKGDTVFANLANIEPLGTGGGDDGDDPLADLGL